MTASYSHVLLASAALVAAAPLAWGQSAEQDSDRSASAQSDNQTTTNPNSNQNNDQQTAENQNRNDAQYRDSNNEDSRRAERQENRQERRDEPGLFGNRDRQPAIGVTIAERGGLGVRVMSVVPNSPASQAGIRPGDMILEVEGRRVETARQLVALIQHGEAGETAEFAVIRDGREYQVPVRLSTREQALPARLRQQDGSLLGQRNASQQQNSSEQSWQQDSQQQYGSNPQQQGQQYQQYQQYGSDQQDRGRNQPPRQPQPPSDRNAYREGSAQQAYYGAQGSDSAQKQRGDDDRRLGERLAQRLTQFEQRLERLSQRLEEIERNGGLRFQAGSSDATQANPENATDSNADNSDDSNDSSEEQREAQEREQQ